MSYSCRIVVVLSNPQLWKGHTFPKGISPKVNVIAWLEFELVYYNVALEHIRYYTMISNEEKMDNKNF